MTKRNQNQEYIEHLKPLIEVALHSPGLLAPNDFKLARYSLDPQTRNQLLDPDICALEDYLIDHASIDHEINEELLSAFADAIHEICHGQDTPIKIGYQHMLWLLTWLNIHIPAGILNRDPNTPLQSLQWCAAVGFSEWGTGYNQIEEALHYLLEMGDSDLWRVREAASRGLYRMLLRSWDRTMRRMRYHSMIANGGEWCMFVAALAHDPQSIIGSNQNRLLDAYTLIQHCLRFLTELDAETHQDPVTVTLIKSVSHAIVRLVPLNPDLGFAQLHVWALWQDMHVKGIVQAALNELADGWQSEVARIKDSLVKAS